MSSEAEALLDKLDNDADARINGTDDKVTKELWNRAHMKAMKLAALIAVGCDHERPVVTLEMAEWAIDQINRDIHKLISRFDNNDVGAVGGNESKQEAAVMRCVKEYCEEPFERFDKYGVTKQMHTHRVFTQSYLSKRVRNLPAFANDRMGPTKALERTLHSLAHITCVFQEFTTEQMIKDYGVRARSYTVSNPTLFFAMIEPT